MSCQEKKWKSSCSTCTATVTSRGQRVHRRRGTPYETTNGYGEQARAKPRQQRPVDANRLAWRSIPSQEGLKNFKGGQTSLDS